MKYLIVCLVCISPLFSYAIDWKTCDDLTFREKAYQLIRCGNEQYRRSFRPGIKLYADSLKHILMERSGTNRLNHSDSLEFVAQWNKLCGDWFYEHGNYDIDAFAKAEFHFKESLNIYQTSDDIGGSLSGEPLIHRELAQLYYRIKKYQLALQHTETAMRFYDEACDLGIIEDNDEEYISLLAQKSICLARIGQIDEALSNINLLLNTFMLDGEVYHETLRKKAKIIMLSNRAGCSNEALPLYQKFFEYRKDLAIEMFEDMGSDERQDYWMRIRPFIADCYQLEDAHPGFLFDVTLFAKGLLLQLNRFSVGGETTKSAIESLKYTWKDIQNKLASNEVAIEFIQYDKNDAREMAALVLKKGESPKWIPLTSHNTFMDLEIEGKKIEYLLYSDNPNDKDLLYQDTKLYKYIWNDAIIKELKGCHKIYFAPDGYLHQIAIEYMIPLELKNIDCYRLTSTRRLMEKGDIDISSALIIGNINYNKQTDSLKIEHNQQNDSIAYCYLNSKNIHFPHLNYTERECDSIYNSRRNSKDTLLTQADATERNFRELSSNYSIVNVATHGYFSSSSIPQGTDIKTSMSDDTMSESAIVLAGANKSLTDENYNNDYYDGILSAKEISLLDLSKVDLMVLSACQTGLGYITSDGVYGLQRGLKNSGVDNIIVSMWNVDDRATSIFFSRFYELLHSGSSLHEAFMEARDDLKNTMVMNKRRTFRPQNLTQSNKASLINYNKPKFYNAFLLIDAIE